MQSLASQFYAFIVTVLIGLTIGVLFDLYRVTKGILRPRKIFVYLGDLLFWIISTLIVFFMLLIGNWGELRFYVLVGIAMGAALYFNALSARVVKLLFNTYQVLKKIVEVFIKGLKFTIFVITYPFFLLKSIIIIPVGYLGLACTKASGLTGRFLGRIFIGPLRKRTTAWKNAVKRKLASLWKRT